MQMNFEIRYYAVHRCEGINSRSEEVQANEYGQLCWDGGARYCYFCGEALPDYISEEARRTAEASYRKWVKW